MVELGLPVVQTSRSMKTLHEDLPIIRKEKNYEDVCDQLAEAFDSGC